MLQLGRTDLQVFPLCIGGSVFGWTATESDSFAVLDTFVAGGGNMIDTADVYSTWVPGNSGGESETIIGRWLASRGIRDKLVLATKVGYVHGGHGDLSTESIRQGIDASLRRLQTDHVDLYYAHVDDPCTPVEETLDAFDGLIRAGKVRYIGASNYSAARLAQALDTSERLGLAAYSTLEVQYNLIERDFEEDLQELCAGRGVAAMPYFALARGFLTGKYRIDRDAMDTRRPDGGREYADERGEAVLRAVEEVAAHHEVPVPSVALAWLRSRATVAAPIASVRTPGQLHDLFPFAELTLDDSELATLEEVGAGLSRSSAASAWVG